jgi:hypothetical protein
MAMKADLKGQEMNVSSLGQVFVVMSVSLILSLRAAEAQTVNLQCSGAFHSYYAQEPTHGVVENHTILVDLSNKKISGFYPRTYPVNRVDEDSIVFSMDVPGPGNVTATALGNINRITGKTIVFATRPDRPGEMVFMYDLMCTPARRLF